MASERSGSMIHRMIGASRLDPEVYEEVEADSSSTGQAFLVVVLVALATGLVSLSLIGLMGLLVGVVVAIVGWVIWAWLVYLIGTKILPSEETNALGTTCQNIRICAVTRSIKSIWRCACCRRCDIFDRVRLDAICDGYSGPPGIGLYVDIACYRGGGIRVHTVCVLGFYCSSFAWDRSLK